MEVEPHAAAGPSYDGDALGWAEHQAALLHARRFVELDIESVGRSERKRGRRSRAT